MEQNMRFRLILGWLTILKKKIGLDYGQFLRVFFSSFHDQIFIFNLFLNVSFI